MKEKNILTYVFGKKRNNDLSSFMKSRVFLLVLLSFGLNLSCDNQEGDKSTSKTNSPPIITSVRILPEEPNIGSDLNVFVQSHNSNGESVTYHYQWMKNDEEVIGEDKNTLRSGNFKKGDLIRNRVTLSDGKVDGAPYLSDPVKILNSPPVIQEVRIEPSVAYTNDNFTVSVKSYDVDGDFVNYTYQWEKNRVILSEERKEILEKGRFKKGDSITVTITPDDGESAGNPRKSEPIIISNSPPIIVSSPPTSADGTTYIYRVEVKDPDDDPILFTLRSGPKGMEIDKSTGLIRWEIHKEDKGSHLIEIEASDDEGGRSFQRFTLVVTN
jgi:hypothetical protein